MNKERFEKIKENVYTRCDIANATGIGLTSPDKEELELINEIERLNKGFKSLEKHFSNREEYENAELVRQTNIANIEWLDQNLKKWE